MKVRKNRQLVDLWVKAKDKNALMKIIEVAKRLGYNALGIEYTDKSIVQELETIKDVRILKRITITSSSDLEIKRSLRGIKLKYDIVAVKPLSYQAARFAARDGRVDLIVADKESLRFIDLSEIRLLERFNGAIEIPLKQLLGLKERILAQFVRRIRLITRYDAPLVLSSSAETFHELWHPLQIIGLMNILGLPETKAWEALTITPKQLIRS